MFIFGDGTHVAAAARIARDEMGFEVAGLGCFNREMARPIRALAKDYGVEALITDDYLEVEAAIAALQPEMILGTQMERHIGKRLGIPCAVISAPVHVQDFPARYSPQMGWEGANVIFDTWVHPLVMGLEEHLLHMFRDDFEFHDEAGASHHGGQHIARPAAAEAAPAAAIDAGSMPAEIAPVVEEAAPRSNVIWLSDAENELHKIPFFVRGKARRNTEKFAARQRPHQHQRRNPVRGKGPLCALKPPSPAPASATTSLSSRWISTPQAPPPASPRALPGLPRPDHHHPRRRRMGRKPRRPCPLQSRRCKPPTSSSPT